MTLYEAKKYWEWKYNRAKDFSDMHWEADERHEHQEYVEALQIAVKALEENAELKRLLKLAVEDMKCNQFVCNLCKHSRSACLKHEKNFECFEWRYADKVKGMIKNGNELDSGV